MNSNSILRSERQCEMSRAHRHNTQTLTMSDRYEMIRDVHGMASLPVTLSDLEGHCQLRETVLNLTNR